MGFGILFAGYFFFLDSLIGNSSGSLSFDILPDFVGWALVLVALIKLSVYSKKLRVGMYISMLMLPVSILSFFHEVASWGSASLYDATEAFSNLMFFIFNGFLLFGIRQIALSCGDGLAKKCVRNFIFTSGYFVFVAVTYIVTSFISPSTGAYLMIYTYALKIVLLVLNLVLIAGAYRRIALE